MKCGIIYHYISLHTNPDWVYTINDRIIMFCQYSIHNSFLWFFFHSLQLCWPLGPRRFVTKTSTRYVGRCIYDHIIMYGGFHKWGYPQMDGLSWKIPVKWMIWKSPHFRTPPYDLYLYYHTKIQGESTRSHVFFFPISWLRLGSALWPCRGVSFCRCPRSWCPIGQTFSWWWCTRWCCFPSSRRLCLLLKTGKPEGTQLGGLFHGKCMKQCMI